MKNILGLDLGTNSIGWAIIQSELENNKEQLKKIKSSGSRIIPMDSSVLGNFDKGNAVSQTSERTSFRGTRRLRERHLLRRERLHRVLDLLGFLPKHYSDNLNRYGKFITDIECKLPWYKDKEGKTTFLFQDSFNEMLFDFSKRHPELVKNNHKIPYDWTIYYLRKKALTKKITKEELAWILLNFNHKRGYYQLRGEEEEISDKKVEFYALKVIKVEDSKEKRGKDTWYNIYLENGMVYRRPCNTYPNWEGKIKEFIVTTDLEKNGSFKKDKEGNIKRSFRAPKEDDWTLIKKKTEFDIDKSQETVGEYIYNALLAKPNQKIRGKLVRTIERKYYKEELRKILNKQSEFHSELQNRNLYLDCVNELYQSNEAYRNSINNHDFTYLFIDNIIFYQRPLKSKKSLIDNCPYEENEYTDKKTGEIKKSPIKCIAKSNPLFQEFRLWHFISNLRIFQKEKSIIKNGYEKTETDVDVTNIFITSEEELTNLFDWLNDRKDIDEKNFFKYPGFKLKTIDSNNYRWNYVQNNKIYPCNETRALILSYLKKSDIPADFLTNEKEKSLWHILYSVENKHEIEIALKTFAQKNALNESFVESFKKIPPFQKEYGSYSEKAIKKLLPLMRTGKYWNEENINKNVKKRIDKIITGEYDEKIRARVREKSINLKDINNFKSLPLWLACYIVYNRHSELKDIYKWKKPSDIDNYLKSFKQHSLHNPIVEQVITETLRTVRDIWIEVGHIDEIHIELGREMKASAEARAKMTKTALDNEHTNLRIKALLTEFMNPEFEIENVRPYSPSQQEILKIYEDSVLKNETITDDIAEIITKFTQSDIKKRPSHTEVMKYKLWLEQKYRSPYTGEMIPLSKLFTPAYEIEHIIPQSRYFDDSLSNKVICESEVNSLKNNSLGYEFIKDNPGRKVELQFGKNVKIFSIEEYEKFVSQYYANNRSKMKKLLLEDIPEDFTKRQLNDSRYISKYIKSLLSNIVREENEQEDTSKNLITCTGGITDRLKKDWGINDKWNEIILPRFERLNVLSNRHDFTSKNATGKLIPTIPLEYQLGYNKKRIDHRHHAMDAIVIACANRNIVNYLNNESASKRTTISRIDLQRLLCDKSKQDNNGNYKWIIKMPWSTFAADTMSALKKIVVTFKQNLRVINKTTNHYVHFENGKKVYAEQNCKENWAIRKPMHKDTIFGEVNLKKIKSVSLDKVLDKPQSIVDKDLKKKIIAMLELGYDANLIKKYFKDNEDVWSEVNLSKIPIYYFTKDTNERFFAVRKPIDTSYDEKKIKEKITDTGIQLIMLNHLHKYKNDPILAFSADGIDEMNRNIISLNNGNKHQPIYKVRTYEKAYKYPIGNIGNKSSKFVESAEGTNLFFAIYENEIVNTETGEKEYKRSFSSIPLNDVIDKQKKGSFTAYKDKNGNMPKYILSPNDLVYLPTEEEIKNANIALPLDNNRIYKMVSSTGYQCFFIKSSIAKSIIDKFEFSSSNKMERAITNEMIKEICIPIKVDRLGNIKKIG